MNKNILANSVQTLKILYMVVAGLALAAGLEELVINDKHEFVLPSVTDNLFLWIFFIIFVSTVVRFVHGAMRHFDHYYIEEPSDRNWEHQPLWDFLFLGCEAFLFFILAFSLDNQPQFINFYLWLMILDIVWLTGVFNFNLKKMLHKTPLRWTLANLVVLLTTGIPWLLCKNNSACPTWLLIIFTLAVITHTIMDYGFGENWKFYFSDSPTSRKKNNNSNTKSLVNTKSEILFIAGAYVGKDYNEIEENIRLAEKVSIELWNRGYKVFCPHLNTRHFEIKANVSEEKYKEFDMAILETCDAVFALENYNSSSGARDEIEYANKIGKKVYYSLDEIPINE